MLIDSDRLPNQTIKNTQMKTRVIKTGKIDKDEFLLDDHGIDHSNHKIFVIVFGEKDGETAFSLGFGSNIEEAKKDAERILVKRFK